MRKIQHLEKMLLPASLFLATLVIMLHSCKKDEEPEPDHNDTPVLTTTIGTNGGTIETESFFMVIPPGTFSSDCKLELFVSDAEVPFKSIAVTRLYKVKGLPEDLSDSLPVRLKYSGSLVDDTYLCHGGNYYDAWLDSSLFGYDLIDCVDSSGYLYGYFIPHFKHKTLKKSQYKSNRQNDPNVIDETMDFFLGITSYRMYVSPVYHVTIKYPTTLDLADIQKYSNYFEEICQFFEQVGFNKQQFEIFRFPSFIDFFDVRELPGNSIAGFRFYENSNRKCYFVLKVLYANDDPDQMVNLRKSTIKAVFDKFIQDEKLFILQPEKWFNKGTLAWCQQNIIDEILIESNTASVFHGLDKSGIEVVTYLINAYGESIISNVYKEIQQGSNVCTAISDITQKPTRQWFPDFFRNYLEGNASNISGEDFYEAVLKDQTITFMKDFPGLNIPTDFINEYADLSAKIYYFNTNDDRIDESSCVLLHADHLNAATDECKLLVFSHQRSTHEIKFLKEGNVISMANLKELKDKGSDLLVVVVNSYYATDQSGQNTSDIKLTVKFTDVERLNVSKCSIWLFKMDVKYLYDDKSEFSLTESFNFTNDNKLDGDFEYVNDSTLMAEWNYTYGDTRYWGNVMLIIDQQSYFITSLEATRNERTINEEKNWNWQWEASISCKNIQMNTDNLEFKVVGNSLHDNLVKFEHRQEWYVGSDISSARQVEEISLTDESYLSVTLW